MRVGQAQVRHSHSKIEKRERRKEEQFPSKSETQQSQFHHNLILENILHWLNYLPSKPTGAHSHLLDTLEG